MSDLGASQPERLTWRVPGRIALLKVLAAAGFIAAAVFLARDSTGRVIAVLAAAALALSGLRDFVAPVRLAADPDGLTVVRHLATRRRIPWREIERVRVHEQRRLFGLRSAFLEIDTGSALHLISQSELGTSPHQVAAALRRYRTGG